MEVSEGDEGGPASGAPAPPLYPNHCDAHANVAEPGNCGLCGDRRRANRSRPSLTVVRETQHCWVHDTDYREICNGCEADRKAAS